MKDKLAFIEGLKGENDQTILKKLPTIQRLSKDKNSEIRQELASWLVLFDNEEIEDVLYQMLFDKNRMVRLEAVDSLCIGRQEKTIEKVKTMISGEGYLIHAYAILTMFDLIVNRYGKNEEAFKRYEEIKTSNNKKKIDEILNYGLEQILPVQRQLAEEILNSSL